MARHLSVFVEVPTPEEALVAAKARVARMDERTWDADEWEAPVDQSFWIGMTTADGHGGAYSRAVRVHRWEVGFTLKERVA